MLKISAALLLTTTLLVATTSVFASDKSSVPSTAEKSRIHEVISPGFNPNERQIDTQFKELQVKDTHALKETLKSYDLTDDEITSLGDRASDVAQLALVKNLTKEQVKHLHKSILEHKDAEVKSLPVKNGRVIDGDNSHPVSSAYYRNQNKQLNAESEKTTSSTLASSPTITDYRGQGSGLHYVVQSNINNWNKASMFVQFPWAYATTDFLFHYSDGTSKWEENDTPYIMFGKTTRGVSSSDIGIYYSHTRGGWYAFNGGMPDGQNYVWQQNWDSRPIPTNAEIQLIVTELDEALRLDIYYHNPANGGNWELHPQSTKFLWHNPTGVWYDMGYRTWGAAYFVREHSLAQTVVDYKSGAYMKGSHEYLVYLYSDSRWVITPWTSSETDKASWWGLTDQDRMYRLPTTSNYSLYTSKYYWDDQGTITYQ